MAGTFTGRDEIFAFLGRLPKETDGTYSSSLIDVLASEDRAAALYRASGERKGAGSTSTRSCCSGSRTGSCSDVLALPSDPAAFETFWSA